MSGGFEIEYFSDIGLGPRYRVDAEEGFITRDEAFMSADGPVADSEKSYPGSFDGEIDLEVARQAYEKILDQGLEPGDFFVSREDDRGFRVQVYGDDSRAVEEVDSQYIDEIVQDLDKALR